MHHRERDERTLRGSPRESFFPERVGGVLCHTPVCISNRVRYKGLEKLFFEHGKNLDDHSSMGSYTVLACVYMYE